MQQIKEIFIIGCVQILLIIGHSDITSQNTKVKIISGTSKYLTNGLENLIFRNVFIRCDVSPLLCVSGVSRHGASHSRLAVTRRQVSP